MKEEQKRAGWEAGEEHVCQKGRERGTEAWPQTAPKFTHPRPPLTRTGLPLGIPGRGHICPTENPGLLATLELDDHTGSGDRESCERTSK